MTVTSVPSGPSVWRFLSRAVRLWIGSFLCVIGLAFTIVGLQDALTEQRYQSHGLTVDATVTGKSIERATRDGSSATRYLIGYRFTSSDGREVEGSSAVSVEDWERLELGRNIPVTYLPDAPLSNRVQGAGEDTTIVAYIFLAIGTVFTLVGGGLVLREGRHVVRSIRVSRHGHLTEGTILRVEPTSTSINRVRQWRIIYRYRDHVGRTQEGESHLLSPDEASLWHEGEIGSIRLDRLRPEFSVWLGKTQ